VKRSGPSADSWWRAFIRHDYGLGAVITLIGVMSRVLHASDGLIMGLWGNFSVLLLVDALFAWLLCGQRRVQRNHRRRAIEGSDPGRTSNRSADVGIP